MRFHGSSSMSFHGNFVCEQNLLWKLDSNISWKLGGVCTWVCVSFTHTHTHTMCGCVCLLQAQTHFSYAWERIECTSMEHKLSWNLRGVCVHGCVCLTLTHFSPTHWSRSTCCSSNVWGELNALPWVWTQERLCRGLWIQGWLCTKVVVQSV